MDELRRLCRESMGASGAWERLGTPFGRPRAVTAGIAQVEMRAKPSGTGGTDYVYTGYASVYGAPFDMWDTLGDHFTEVVAPGAARRSLNNPDLDVGFLIGHNEAGYALSRTTAGDLKLSDDGHGVHVEARMDGSLEAVRHLASAVERRHMTEMSLAFVCKGQEWDRDYETRTITGMELNRGDVSAVIYGANPATAGSLMIPAEQLTARRPAIVGGSQMAIFRALAASRERRMPTAAYQQGADEHAECGQCHSGNDVDAAYCDQCGTELNPAIAYCEHPDDTQVCPWCRCMNAPDAKVCDQCGRGMVNDHDGDDPGYAGGAVGADHWMDYTGRRPLERRAALSAADVNDLPDSAFAYIEGGGSKDDGGKTTPRSKRHFPVHDAAHVRNALARAPQSPFGPKAMPAIKAAAAKLGIGDSEQKALARPLERRASAADDLNSSVAPDYDPGATSHEAMTGTHEHQHEHPDGEQMTHAHAHDGDADHSCATSAVVTVDDSTGIPGPEEQLSAAALLVWRMRELELEELAGRRVPAA